MKQKIVCTDVSGNDETTIADSSFNYWNNQDTEKRKVFNIDEGFSGLEESKHLVDIYNQVSSVIIDQCIEVDGKEILSLASGSCWLESWLLKDKRVRELVALDFSKHRIHDLAVKTIKHYRLNFPIKLVVGDIVSTGEEDDKFDLVILSQAFHHTENPIAVLREIIRVTKKGGKVIIVGEHYYGGAKYMIAVVKHFIKYFINWKGYRSMSYFFPGYSDLFPPCIEKGDVHYSLKEYEYMFDKVGMLERRHYVDSRGEIQAFCLTVEK